MHPQPLVEKALASHLNVIAICDHNSSENIPYVLRAAQGKNLKIFPGMEITSSEEVHIIALFESLDGLSVIQQNVYQNLKGENNEDRFGMQIIVNELGEVEGFNKKLLIGATEIPLNELLEQIHQQNGLTIASHIDRESFSVLSQLGFIDESFQFDALEVSALLDLQKARAQYPELKQYALITSSDAHYLEDIGKVSTKIIMENPSLSELKMAFLRQNGRQILE
jgi:predicted metal-dependent phosphoesterase TrpH